MPKIANSEAKTPEGVDSNISLFNIKYGTILYNVDVIVANSFNVYPRRVRPPTDAEKAYYYYLKLAHSWFNEKSTCSSSRSSVDFFEEVSAFLQ